MLVLSRKAGEQIRIGEDIVLVVLGIDAAGHVKLGIDAPRSTRVLREEIYQAIAQENVRAGCEPPGSGSGPLATSTHGQSTTPP